VEDLVEAEPARPGVGASESIDERAVSEAFSTCG
jgi:hypothetical protein